MSQSRRPEDALILAAGKGVRMGGLCRRCPKPMLPLAHVPILEGIADSLARAGIRRVHVVVGYLEEVIHDYFRDRRVAAPDGSTVEMNFIHQEEATGTGSATLLGRPLLSDRPFLMAFGDIITPGVNYAHMLDRYARGNCEAVLSTRRVLDPCFGAAVYVEDDRVVKIIEKPEPGTSTTPFDNAGLFVFSPGIFDLLEKVGLSPRGEYELTDAIAMMLGKEMVIAPCEMEGYWVNLVGPESLLKANAEVMAWKEAAGEPMPVSESCRIGQSEIGHNVSIGEEVVIGRGCRIADSILTRGTRVGDGAQLRHAITEPGAQISDNARIEGTAEEAVVVER